MPWVFVYSFFFLTIDFLDFFPRKKFWIYEETTSVFYNFSTFFCFCNFLFRSLAFFLENKKYKKPDCSDCIRNSMLEEVHVSTKRKTEVKVNLKTP